MIKINPANQTQEDKPIQPSSLADKVGGFKFGIKPSGESSQPSVQPVQATEQEQPELQQKKLLIPVASKTQLVDKVQQPVTPIPELSNDKYEVVADSVAEFSEDTGNEFQQQLAMLQESIDSGNQLKDQMENILIFLDDNPQYKDNVSPKDVAVFVAACRKVAGITVQEKQTRKTSKKKTDEAVESLMGDLADLTFDI